MRSSSTMSLSEKGCTASEDSGRGWERVRPYELHNYRGSGSFKSRHAATCNGTRVTTAERSRTSSEIPRIHVSALTHLTDTSGWRPRAALRRTVTRPAGAVRGNRQNRAAMVEVACGGTIKERQRLTTWGRPGFDGDAGSWSACRALRLISLNCGGTQRNCERRLRSRCLITSERSPRECLRHGDDRHQAGWSSRAASTRDDEIVRGWRPGMLASFSTGRDIRMGTRT